MKRIYIRLETAILLLCCLALLAPSTMQAQVINLSNNIRHQVIKKKIYPMPQAENDISSLPPRFLNPRPKSDISRASSVKLTTKNRHAMQSRLSYENQTPRYDPSGKIDPFVPLVEDKPIIKSGLVKPTIPVRPAETLLEKIDLSQLKLTAIILRNKGNRGLVQESSGRGHIIAENTYIGTRGGKVAEIEKNRVIIEEKAIDDFGKIIVEKKELVLRSYVTQNGVQSSVVH